MQPSMRTRTQWTSPSRRPPRGRNGSRLVDTNLQPPRDFTPGGNKGVDDAYSVAPFSSILLLAK